MKIYRIILIVFISVLLIHCSTNRSTVLADPRIEWWDNARFGMFIHWGLYSIPGGMWNGKKVEELGEWIQAYADISDEDYGKLAAQFNPEKFNAAEWVQMAKKAGMKYLVITTRHHDGFCLFDTEYTDWDVMDATPFKRDIVKELKEECEKAGIKFCIYYTILEWHHPAMELNTNFEDLDEFSDHALEGGGFTNIDSTWRKYGNVEVKKGKKQEFINYMKSQLKELIENYEPGIIWFDGGWVDWWTPEDGKELLDYLWSLNPDLIFNNRAGEDFENDTWFGDYGTPEQSIPTEGLDYRWESCMTMNSTWGYKSYDHNWKSSQLLIIQLVDIMAKGGNFLLNIGPEPDGTFPEKSIERLNDIQDWIAVNHEFVEGTRMWERYMEGKHEMLYEYYDIPDVSAVQLPFTSKDIRFTTRDNVVYAACLNWAEKEFNIKSLGKKLFSNRKVLKIEMLGSDENLSWKQGINSLEIKSPDSKPCNYVYVFKIYLEEN